MKSLMPGIFVQCADGSDFWRSRISLCSGLVPAGPVGYSENAFIPRGDWRDPTEAELQMLDRLGARSLDASEALTLWQLPEPLFRPFAFIGRALKARNREYIGQNLLTTDEFKRAADGVLLHLRNRGFGDSATLLGHCCCPPGLATVGVANNVYVGMHIDSYIPQDGQVRPGFPNRLCINLGPERRYLVVSNLTIESARQISGSLFNDHPISAQREYINSFADYPLLRIAIDPGEGYFAPTQIVIHDGSTLDKEYFDPVVTYIGRFGYDQIQQLCTVDEGKNQPSYSNLEAVT